MDEPGCDIESNSPAEFRADPGAYWPIIIVCAVLALLATAGTVWGAIKPGPVDVLRILVPPFLALFSVVCVIGVRYYWVQLHRRYRLVQGGLECFDGRQSHGIAWKSVREVYEVVSSVKLLGLTVDAPQLDVGFITLEGVRGEIDKSVLGADKLAPIVAREVNRRLSERVRNKLERRQGETFGCVSVSETGIEIQEPPAKAWWQTLKHRFESNVDAGVVVPGEYAWHDVRDIHVVAATRGDRTSDRTTYSQLQVRVNGEKSPVLIWAVREFPNFTVFCEVLEKLGHPLTSTESQAGSHAEKQTMSDDEFGDDFGDEAPRSAPGPGKKKKKKVPASRSGQTPAGKSSDKRAGPSQKEKVQLYVLAGVFLLTVIPFAIFMTIRQGRMQDAEQAAFAAEIDQLLQPPQDGAAPPGKPGKFAEVDVGKRELDVYHGNLGVDMRAVTPAEADYIVQVNETREIVAEYTDGSKGIKVTLELTVIDKPTWTVLDRKTFVGDDPPLVAFGSSGDVVKQPERDEVKAYYKSLVGME